MAVCVVESPVHSSLAFKFADELDWQKERTLADTLTSVVENFTERRHEPRTKLNNDLTTAVYYIHRSNVGECVGTQTVGETSAVVEGSQRTGKMESYSREERESINTFRALCHAERLMEEMDRSGLLTVQQVCDIHAILLQGLHRAAGKIRDGDVYTRTEDGSIHMYPPPTVLEERFYCIIDRHNIHMNGIKRLQNPQQRVEYVFKCAAWFLYHLVSLHPFPDGNGRTCRLLASYVLSSSITPFPVSICHSDPLSSRRDYVCAIIHCREHPEEGPTQLASMLLEGAYLGWKWFSTNREMITE